MLYCIQKEREREENKMRYIVIASNETTYTRLPFNTLWGAHYQAQRMTEKPYNWPKAQVVDTETGEIVCEFVRA